VCIVRHVGMSWLEMPCNTSLFVHTWGSSRRASCVIVILMCVEVDGPHQVPITIMVWWRTSCDWLTLRKARKLLTTCLRREPLLGGGGGAQSMIVPDRSSTAIASLPLLSKACNSPTYT
jgi:hypothetical protein